MAAGDTDINICSRALTLIGAAAISSFNDGTDASSTCARLYPTIKLSLLQMYPWKFATKKVQLARLVAAPVNEWKYAYQIPGDALGNVDALFVSASAGAGPIPAGWEIYGDRVLTNYETVYIDYRFDPGEDKYKPYFVLLLIYALAANLADAITEVQAKADRWQILAFGGPQDNGRGGFFRQAANMDGRGAPPEAIQDFPLVSVRF